MAFTALNHYLDAEWLRYAYECTRRDGAVGSMVRRHRRTWKAMPAEYSICGWGRAVIPVFGYCPGWGGCVRTGWSGGLNFLSAAVYLVSWLCGPQTTCILEFCGKIEMYIVLR